jgi:hypothetical protein
VDNISVGRQAEIGIKRRRALRHSVLMKRPRSQAVAPKRSLVCLKGQRASRARS